MGKTKQKRPVGGLFKPVPIDWKRECIKAQDACLEEAKRAYILRDDVSRLQAARDADAKTMGEIVANADHNAAQCVLKDEQIGNLRRKYEEALGTVETHRRERDHARAQRETKEGLLQLAETKLGEARAELDQSRRLCRDVGAERARWERVAVDRNAELVDRQAEIESLKRQLTKQLEREAKAVAELEQARDDYARIGDMHRRAARACAERDIARSLDLGELESALGSRVRVCTADEFIARELRREVEVNWDRGML